MQQFNNNEWKSIAEWLYGILDDIDTVDDIAKENDYLYREIVHRLQKLKNKVGRSDDGQTVIFTPINEEYGITRIISNWLF